MKKKVRNTWEISKKSPEPATVIEAMQSRMISLPVKSLMQHKFTIIYEVYN